MASAGKPARTRVVIAADERPARIRVRRLLEQRPELEVVGEADSGPATIEVVRRVGPELVVLDLQMPGCGGLEALRGLAEAEWPVAIFVTGFDVVTLDLLEAGAMPYLVKPYRDDQFAMALRQATETVAGGWRALWDGRLRSLLTRSAGPHRLGRFAIREGDETRFIATTDVDWIEAAADYVRLHCGDTVHSVRATMQTLDETLGPDEFVRVHRSHLVRIDRVDHLEPHHRGEDSLVLRDHTRVKVGRTYRDVVRTKFSGLGMVLVAR